MSVATIHPVREELAWLAAHARTPRLRTMRQFATDEIVVPEGKYRGSKLRIHRQPYTGLLFDAIDSGRWTRFAVTGPVQSGKTLCGWVTPLLYHLFEHRETLVCGIPTMDVAADKWREEILPAIVASRYRDQLPSTGAGSRGGGKLEAVKFRNGATLRLMSGHGGDEKRSSFTARVASITEADKMDEAGEASREADPVTQIEGRLASYEPEERRLYMECTPSIPQGRIWREYTGGTASRIACPCPYCRRLVTPEREHLRGWQEAETKYEARRNAHFVCPECNELLTGEDRRAMNQAAVLVHRGQETTPEGRVVGEPAETDTLGFRWNAFNNLFWSPGAIGLKEWSAANDVRVDRDDAEKELMQFYWAQPFEPPDVDLTPLDTAEVARRKADSKRGIVPAGTAAISVGIDTGKYELHWLAIAWNAAGAGRVIDYGIQQTECRRLGLQLGLTDALRRLKAYFDAGWTAPDGAKEGPRQVWIDAGWHEHADAVYAFCRGANAGLTPGCELYRASRGYGEGQQGMRKYVTPDKTDTKVRFLGREYHLSRSKRAGQLVAHVNADHWKSELHQRLAMPATEATAITLYDAPDARHHAELSAQLTAEMAKREWLPNRGWVYVWERLRRKNHFLDAAYNATAAGHLVLALLARPPAPRPKAPEPQAPTMFAAPGGGAFLITQR